MPRPCRCNRFIPGKGCMEGECYYCWLYHHDDVYRASCDGARTPGIARSASTFARALLRHARDWFKQAGRAEYTRRRSACDACPHRDPAKDRCNLCGCCLEGKLLSKLKWASETCPDTPPRW